MDSYLIKREDNMNTVKFEKAPQLSMVAGKWCLSSCFQIGEEDYTVSLMIDHSWDGACWDRYKVELWNVGESYEVVSIAEYDTRYENIIHWEGTEVANAWAEAGSVCHSHSSTQARQAWTVGEALIKRWESMQALGLFTPHVTL
jgi:hypothetical protein